MMSETELVNKYLKVKYLSGGMDPSVGLNCWGLVKAVYKDIGLSIEDFVDYAEKCSLERKEALVEFYHSSLEEVEKPRPFDVVLLSFDGFLHAGIVLTGRRFLHMGKKGSGVCRLNRPYWKNKVLGYYRSVQIC